MVFGQLLDLLDLLKAQTLCFHILIEVIIVV